MANDSKTEFRLTQIEGRMVTLSDRTHKLGNDLLQIKLTMDKEDSYIDWREWRTQVLIWATIGIIGGIIVTIIFYAKAHV